MQTIEIKNLKIGPKTPLVVMCGPCVIESEEHSLFAAEHLSKIFSEAGIGLIFKSSYDKANRSAYDSFRGVGIDEGLRILQKVQEKLSLAVVTDVHSPQEAAQAGLVCEVLQIPAFLCRQTDLLLAAGATGKVVSVKKGQFMAPKDMKNVVEKLHSTGNRQVILTERGASFGYNNLVCDMRSIPIMQSFGAPVCFDATHAVQLPGGGGNYSGGERQFIPTLAKAAIAAGANCLFMEAHNDPQNAKSDKDSVIDFKALPKLLKELKAIYDLVRDMQ